MPLVCTQLNKGEAKMFINWAKDKCLRSCVCNGRPLHYTQTSAFQGWHEYYGMSRKSFTMYVMFLRGGVSPRGQHNVWEDQTSLKDGVLSNSIRWWFSLWMIWFFWGFGIPDLMTELCPPQDTAQMPRKAIEKKKRWRVPEHLSRRTESWARKPLRNVQIRNLAVLHKIGMP